MNYTKMILSILFCSMALLTLSACAPEVGSEKWCAQIKEKSKGDWTVNEATDYTKYCLFK
jgi:hypothetical protein